VSAILVGLTPYYILLIGHDSTATIEPEGGSQKRRKFYTDFFSNQPRDLN
jgi:hypothetical protein